MANLKSIHFASDASIVDHFARPVGIECGDYRDPNNGAKYRPVKLRATFTTCSGPGTSPGQARSRSLYQERLEVAAREALFHAHNVFGNAFRHPGTSPGQAIIADPATARGTWQ